MSENLENINIKPDSVEGEIDDNDLIIKEIQDLRKRGINDLLLNGKLPRDVEDRAFLIQLMNAATSTAVSVKKIKSNEKQEVNRLAQVRSFAEAIRISRSKQAAKTRQSAEDRSQIPKLDPRVVPGHTDQGTIPLFAASIGGDTSPKEVN